MTRSRRYKVLWTLWMAGGGLLVAASFYVLTGSWGWTVLALLVSGPMLNGVAQIVTQPLHAARTSGRGRPARRS